MYVSQSIVCLERVVGVMCDVCCVLCVECEGVERRGLVLVVSVNSEKVAVVEDKAGL